jgi:hypothetical protein
MPQRPKNAKNQCCPDGIEPVLKPRKSKSAPADFLEQPNNDHGREEKKDTYRLPIGVGAGGCVLERRLQ